MALMDGSDTLFAARFNSGVVHKLNGEFLGPGDSVTVKDHEFIWVHEENMSQLQTVVFIQDFERSGAPHPTQPEALEAQSLAMPRLQQRQV